ncbi:Armadillo repeat-containing protein 3 [Rhizophlyctis rosea]|nr:Armadillo repeat-containing protein 3 [Rhizophlyctis rosea]
MRSDILKHGGIHALVTALAKGDLKVQATALLALARCMHDAESRIALSKEPQEAGIGRAIELLESKDITVCRNAAYAISNAAQYEPNAVAACAAGALQAMINLMNDTGRNATKFATDALEKLLNYQLSAKYWLRSRLSTTNIIRTGFYDPGHAPLHHPLTSSTTPHHTLHFPSLESLRSAPLDTKRETLLIDTTTDQHLSQLLTYTTTQIFQSTRPPLWQIKALASVVAQHMGGSVGGGSMSEEGSDMGARFRVAELKLKAGGNIILIGTIDRGTFYHRALLFKTLCDLVTGGGCGVEIVRGEYGRCWNVLEVGRWKVGGVSGGAATEGEKEKIAGVEEGKKVGIRPESAGKEGKDGGKEGKRSSTARHGSKDAVAAAASATQVANAAGGPQQQQQPAQQAAPAQTLLKEFVLPSAEEDFGPAPQGPVIVDLMFEPGRLMSVGSKEAEAYQRLG